MNNKPLIIVSTQCFPPVTGGIETLMYSLCYALSATGRQVSVYADHDTATERAFDSQQPFTTKRYAGIKPWRRRKKAWDIYHRSSAEQPTPPVLITDSWKSLEHINTERFASVLCMVHGTEIPQHPAPAKRERIQKAFSRARFIVTNSEYTASRLTVYVDDPEKVKVILPGISEPLTDDGVNARIASRLADYDPVLITLARLEQRKGQIDVVRLLPELVHQFPRLLYVIAGDGSCMNLLEQETARLGVQEHVVLTGTLGDPEKSAWLQNSTLFIMPGKIVGADVEGFGLAYIEAGLHGIPAIASSAGGAPEAVLHGQTGLVVPADDREGLLEATMTLLRDRPYCLQLGNNARIRAHNFLWRHKSAEYLQLLE